MNHQESSIKKSEFHHYFSEPEACLSAVKKVIKKTEVVLDIGCGIVPMRYFKPTIHFMVEPWKEYSDILSYQHANNKSVIVFCMGGLEALRTLADNSIDSIFLLDVIEHLEKEEGLKVLKEMERVAREQIIIFTPLGFMPQHMESGELDAWGLSGTSVQEHRSGWEPEEFSSEWSFYICETYHRTNFRNEKLEVPHGAFFAIRNFEDKKNIVKPEKIPLLCKTHLPGMTSF
ncbi:MAG: class I SAM-dependent methyltransferase [Gammaproteobacteria bacterium]|nr:class I SAM-dependent methyltransferase [Gammaproteobacteria bacterium]